MKIKSLLITTIIGASLIGCVSSVDEEALKAEMANVSLMSDQEILALVPGSTISGISSTDGKTKWVQNYSEVDAGVSKGTGKGDFGGDPYDFKWKVKEGQLCEDWGSGKGCWSLELVEDGKAIQRYGKKGKLKYLIYIE